MVYEIRVYEAVEGRAEAMRKRFKDVVAVKFFPRHGIELVGAFVAPEEDGRLTYITRFASEEARKAAWAAFGVDSEWAAAKKASETDGPLLKNQTVNGVVACFRRPLAGLKIMKPAPFDYVRPGSVAEACELLAADEDARVIAGGQTLVPMLAMRLARPARLIDVLRLPELSGIREDNGSIVIGATTRQAFTLNSPLIRKSVPLLALALPWGRASSDPQSRNRWRLDCECGSLCGNSAGCRDVGRRDRSGVAGWSYIDTGGRLLYRSHADRDRHRRMSQRGSFSGLDPQADWRWFPRDQRSQFRFCVCLCCGAGRS